MPNFSKTTKPKLWKVVQATGRVVFIERGTTRFGIQFDDGTANEIAHQLNQYETKLAQLQTKYDDLVHRT